MKHSKQKVCLIVLVVTLAGTMTTIIKVHGTSTFDGTVEDCSDNPISGAVVTLRDYYLTYLGSDTTDSSGDYSFGVTLNGNSPYFLSVSKTRFTTGMEMVYDEGTNDFELVGIGEKIAVFFWASDVGVEDVMDDYIELLEDEEDYDTFYKFEDSTNVASDCATVDAYEIDADTIFVYVTGHGIHSDGHSVTYFYDGDSMGTASNTFRGYMDLWEANRKAILVDSCHAGDWADDFAASPYLAMASSSENHHAHSYLHQALPYELELSHYFIAQINLGAKAVAAFSHASTLCWDQYAKISDCSSYEWFD